MLPFEWNMPFSAARRRSIRHLAIVSALLKAKGRMSSISLVYFHDTTCGFMSESSPLLGPENGRASGWQRGVDND